MKQFENSDTRQNESGMNNYLMENHFQIIKSIHLQISRRFLVVQAAWNATISDNRATQAGGSIVQEYAY
jgi:hypothetical protein